MSRLVDRAWRRRLVPSLTVIALAMAARATAGTVLAELADGDVLESASAEEPADPSLVADLLLVEVVRARIATGTLAPRQRVPVVATATDHGPVATRDHLEVGELLQLLLLTGSRTAALSLATAVGPGLDAGRERMRRSAQRLALTGTTLPDAWPSSQVPGTSGRSGAPRGVATLRDLAHVAIAVVRDDAIRRLLERDGTPIADGAIIARATAPLVSMRSSGALQPPARVESEARGAIVREIRDGLDLLAVASGPDARLEASRTLERGFTRYERVALVRTGQRIGPEIAIHGGIIPRFTAVASEGLALTVRRDARTRVGFRLQLPAVLEAPIEVDQAVGELVVERDGALFAVVPLVAPVSVAPSRWLDTARQ